MQLLNVFVKCVLLLDNIDFHFLQVLSTAPFQLLHVDLWEPYRVPTYNKCTFFMTIVDDYSRSTWIHMLKQNFISYVNTQFHTLVQCIRTDNAKELCEGALKLFLC